MLLHRDETRLSENIRMPAGGGLCDDKRFGNQRHAHAELHRVNRPLIGYGLSEMREEQDVFLAVQNKVLAALLAEWGLERPDILAHDFGGANALRACSLKALRFASLAIFEAFALAPWGSTFVQHQHRHEAAFSGMPDHMHIALLRAHLQTTAHDPLSEKALSIYSAPWLGPVGQPAFHRQIAQMDQGYTDEVEARLRRMECPVTVLWGQNDDWIPYAKGEALAGLISDRPLIPIPDARHPVQVDSPEVFVAAVLKSLGGI